MFDEAINLLGLESPFDLIQLKDAYRRTMKQWHPDLNPHQVQRATEICQSINAAYDLLEAIAAARTDQGNGQSWSNYMKTQLPEWEKEFKAEWRKTYWKSCEKELYPGLHFSTCLINFKRAAIEPRPDWFRACLFKDTPKKRTQYREHLLKIAPNQKLREQWARKYFLLEFGDSSWVFYLPASRLELTAGRTR